MIDIELRERALQYAIQSCGSHHLATEIVRAAQLYADFIAGTHDAEIVSAAKKLAEVVSL